MMFLTSLAVLATVMLGPVTMQEATIWVRTDRPATVHVEYVDGRGRSFRTRDVRTSHETALTASLICDSVVPGMTYTYRVIIDGDAVATDVPTSFTTPALWKWRSDELPSASIMFGSCFYVNEDGYERWDSTGRERGYGSEFEILDAMTRTPSDVMLWLGDNIYLREADWTSRTGILRRHTHTRSFPALQPFLLSRPHYAIWDDHDFGPDNSDRSFVLRDAALEAHKLFWPAPSWGVGGFPGITSSFDVVDVQVFMLDVRMYRSPEHRDDEESTILGEHQVQWLMDALAASRATFKVIATGSQFFGSDPRKEGFHQAENERRRIIDFITEHKISGVLFLSGDIHGAELLRYDRAGTYSLYEFTSSPITAGTNSSLASQRSDHRVDGTVFTGHNFGVLRVSGRRKDRVLTLELYDKDGRTVWQRSLHEKHLK